MTFIFMLQGEPEAAWNAVKQTATQMADLIYTSAFGYKKLI